MTSFMEFMISAQGRRQDFAKGGADARRELPTPLQSEVWWPSGVWESLEAHEIMILEWLVQLPFSFASSFLFLLSFSLPLPSLSLLFSLPLPSLSSLLSPFFFGGGEAAAPSAPPLPTPLLKVSMAFLAVFNCFSFQNQINFCKTNCKCCQK